MAFHRIDQLAFRSPADRGANVCWYGRSFRNPSAFQLFDADGLSAVANPAARPESVDTVELDIERRIGKRLNLLTAAYYQTVAFVNNINIYPIAKNAWADYPAQGINTTANANYPRLTTQANPNNYQNSSFWMKNGSFLRLRNVELGYTLPAAALKSMHVDKLRIYVSAVNPVSWSSLQKHYNMDPETPSGYPILKSYNAGISLTF